MKRGLIFSITYFPFVGGAEVAVKEITDRISDVHFDMVTLRISNKLPSYEKIGNVHIHRIGFSTSGDIKNLNIKFPLSLNKFLFPILALLKARRLHKKHKYDFIWAIMANYAGFAAMFFKTMYSKVPYLLTLQEGDPIESIYKKVKWIHPLFKKIFTKADSIQAISSFLVGFAKDMGYTGDIKVVPNGVDIEKFNHYFQESEIQRIKNKIKKEPNKSEYSNEDIILITTSRLVHKNGIDTLINTIKILPDYIKLLIIGSGPLVGSLKSKADDIDPDRIIFLGQVDYDEIPLYLHSSDIFIRPSRSEGFGNSFVEAMAARIPVIATPVGGITDFVFDPHLNKKEKPTGLFCKVNDPESIKEEVMLLLKERELRKSIIENAENLVKEKYSWKKVAKEMSNIFDKITDNE